MTVPFDIHDCTLQLKKKKRKVKDLFVGYV